MTRRSFPEWAKRLFQVLLPVLILGGGVIGARALIAARPEVKKRPSRPARPLSRSSRFSLKIPRP